MRAISTRADPSAVAGASSSASVNTAPTQNREEKRLFSLRGAQRMKQFPLRLKAYAQWMKRFLHGAK